MPYRPGRQQNRNPGHLYSFGSFGVFERVSPRLHLGPREDDIGNGLGQKMKDSMPYKWPSSAGPIKKSRGGHPLGVFERVSPKQLIGPGQDYIGNGLGQEMKDLCLNGGYPLPGLPVRCGLATC
jgi:hypothetical protein